MKTPYYFLLAVMLMVFTGCKKEDPNARQRNSTTEAAEAACTPRTSFDLAPGKSTLKLVNNDTEIQANFTLMVEDTAFAYHSTHIPLIIDNGKAIAFMYYKDGDTTQPDNDTESKAITVTFTIDNPIVDPATSTRRWSLHQRVRIIPFNEYDYSEFIGLTDFFKLKADTFKDQFACPEHNEELVEMWNHYNPGNPVYTKKSLKIIRPRITKDDGVLSISR